MKQTTNTIKLALAGVLTALAIVGSFLSFPVAGSKCAPVQHMVNIFAAVLLGPGWGVGIAFCASLLRNILGIGSLMAFPGSMIGALCCGLVYKKCKNLSLTCLAEALGTGILGGIAAYPVALFLMGAAPAGLLFFLRRAKNKQEFRRILADADVQGKKIVESLVQKGFLRRVETVKEKTHGQTGIKALRMAVPPDALPPVTKTQQKLVRILQEVDALSEKEACYLSGVTSAVAKKLVQNGVVESYTVKPPMHSYASGGQTQQPTDIILSAEQQAVYDRMVAALEEGMHCFLLHGVTGSGKTSVFIRLIDTVVQRGKQVILMVPEIALTPQIMERFYSLFGDIVAVIHSELSLGQRSETWRSIASGEAKIIIGTRSAVFAPVQDLGLIVVDEEGERTYKSDSAPRRDCESLLKD